MREVLVWCYVMLIVCQQMLAVRMSLTEILLEVTDQEIHMVSQEEFNRYTAAQGICTTKLFQNGTRYLFKTFLTA